MQHFCTSITIYIFLVFSYSSIHAASTSIEFYSEHISIEYDLSIVSDQPVRCNEKSITDFYKNLETTQYQVLLKGLNQYKTELQLNDWLYYELMNKVLDRVLDQQSSLQQTLTTWFLLSKSGYDTRLTYLQEEAFVYVHTVDNLFEVPMIEEWGRFYTNLSAFKKAERHYASEVFMLDFLANKNGHPFSFYMPSLPKLSSNLREKVFRFKWKDHQYRVDAHVDLTIIELMKNYPIIDEAQYLEIPLSRSLGQSIMPQLQTIIEDRSHKEALEILVAFTRSAFQYKEDHDYFGKSKPMIADEVFHYPYSDCEDRSALFYNLVKELLDLPMIMIAYPDHLTIGVALSQPIGNPIRYNGKKYYICDPTGPSNSTEIGRVPKNYLSQSFEILAAYK